MSRSPTLCSQRIERALDRIPTEEVAMRRIEYSRARQGAVGHLMERLWCSWRGHRWGFAYQQAEFARIAETGPGGLVLRAVEIPAVEWTTHRCPRCDLLRAVGEVLADGHGGARPSRSPEEPARR